MSISLIFNQKYKSIKSLNDIGLPDLSIITGKNGCGKSHLLEAIEKGSIKANDYSVGEIIRYDYLNFNIGKQNQIYKITLDEYQIKFIDQVKSLRDRPNFKLVRGEFDNPTVNVFKGYRLLDQDTDALSLFISKLNHRNIFDLDNREIQELLDYCFSVGNLLKNNLSSLFLDYAEKLKKDNRSLSAGGKGISESKFNKIWDNDSPWAMLNKMFNEYGLKHKIIAPYKDTDNYTYQAEIEVDGEKINFDDLSSGEKIFCQLILITYRGNLKLPKLLLLDEIDASLHPSMIQKIFNVINEVFIKNGTKVILVTHSPTTVALADESSLFCLANNELKSISQEEAIDILTEGFMSFDKALKIVNKSRSKDLVILTEGKTDVIHFEKALKYLNLFDDLSYEIVSCDSADNLKQFLVGIPKELTQNTIFIGVFDYDDKGNKCYGQFGKEKIINNFSFRQPKEGAGNKKVYAVQIEPHIENCKKQNYYPVEYMYSENILKDHDVLELRTLQELTVNLNDEDIKTYSSRHNSDNMDVSFYKVKNDIKKSFANGVQLDNESRERFRLLFQRVLDVYRSEKN
ncbi:AAA family ATPase [Francisella sp. LA112445]|uniref:ATP-dependent nuclease n=1 Tax=Francisella sp. LA112445 TaxID=1395624 RepID=UPI001788A80C|nr:AAA family ATPase [Francisella sp. LA112445]QIW10402.1 hypothetical protein FIP56_06695 [Francisella sp. LA112445]